MSETTLVGTIRTVHDVAMEVGLSGQAVRMAEARGDLRAAAVTKSGVRLFDDSSMIEYYRVRCAMQQGRGWRRDLKG